jgi:hypothetical protein
MDFHHWLNMTYSMRGLSNISFRSRYNDIRKLIFPPKLKDAKYILQCSVTALDKKLYHWSCITVKGPLRAHIIGIVQTLNY